MTPKLSLVTGTLNRPESLNRLVDSVLQHTDVPFELVIADASDVPVKIDDARVRILPERPRLGYVKGHNRAFREALGEWVLFLNDDAEVCPGYASESVSFMESHPQIGLGALHYSEDGGEFHVNSAWGAIYPNFGILRRTLGNQIGWFDEELEMYGSDNSLALRVLMADLGIADIPKARIIHHSVKDQLRIDNQKNRQRDNYILQTKYKIGTKWIEAAFNKHRVDTGTVPWSHGVRERVLR